MTGASEEPVTRLLDHLVTSAVAQDWDHLEALVQRGAGRLQTINLQTMALVRSKEKFADDAQRAHGNFQRHRPGIARLHRLGW